MADPSFHVLWVLVLWAKILSFMGITSFDSRLSHKRQQFLPIQRLQRSEDLTDWNFYSHRCFESSQYLYGVHH